LTALTRALTFILAQQRGKTPRPVVAREIQVKTGQKSFMADVYEGAAPLANPIIFLHGMSPLGIRDPRQVLAVRALAATGFRVICPEIDEIKALKIQARSISTFCDVAGALLSDRELCPSGRAAFFAPSFSGAICLVAAAQSTFASRISAVCALGSMAQVRGSMEYLFLSDDADTYARYIVLANYLPFAKKYRALTPYFAALARDNWNASAAMNPRLQGFEKINLAEKALKKLSPNDKKMALSIIADRDFRAKVFQHLTPLMEGELTAYDVVSVAQRIQAPTLLMHGASDNVIPADESRRLAPHLQKPRLVISPFLGHADTAVSLKLIGDVVRLVTGFAWFFRHAAR